jgi:hypothetical protein
MSKLPIAFTEIREIFFIADDATGPFIRVIQFVQTDGQVVTVEGRQATDDFVHWLNAQNPDAARHLEVLLNEADKRNLEVLIYRKPK